MVSNRSKKKPKKKIQEPEITENTTDDAWLPPRAGLTILVVVTVAFIAWTTWQGMKTTSFGESLVTGLILGGSIWVIFLVIFLFNRFVRRR